MVRKGRLLAALDAHKGRDFEAEKRKKQLKNAEKRKRKRTEAEDEEEEQETSKIIETGDTNSKASNDSALEAFEAFSSGEEEQDSDEYKQDGAIIPQPEITADNSASEVEEESDLALSDLSEEDREDVVPHQRMTINNGPALVASRKRIAVVSDKPRHPFHLHNSLVSTDQPADTLIPDPMDDETRELMFYKIARDATVTARTLLKKEKIPFSRPSDYFAEMVKTDDHMEKVKKKLYDEAASKKAAQEARRLRDAKKFGKQVQIAKEQERAKEKKDTFNKIKELKRSKSLPISRLQKFFLVRLDYGLTKIYRTQRQRHRSRNGRRRPLPRNKHRRQRRRWRHKTQPEGTCERTTRLETTETGCEVWVWRQEEVLEVRDGRE